MTSSVSLCEDLNELETFLTQWFERVAAKLEASVVTPSVTLAATTKNEQLLRRAKEDAARGAH